MLIADRLGMAAAIAAMALSMPAAAAVLYSNGPCDCETNALEIDAGFSVANSFSLAAESSIDQINFTSWTSLGTTIASIDWAILTASPADGGVVVLSGTAPVAFTFGFLNSKNFGVYQEYFKPTGARRVAAGDYWLQLGNATLSFGGNAYWDQNNGSSMAYSSASGVVGSEAFDIIGGAPTPEPATWWFMLVGFGTAGAALRSRQNVGRGSVALTRA
jgi:hypothetical protein